MTTITFYSYKGGVGRSLVVANVAKYLQRFGQKVFTLDFDLEAPGLHYKFALGAKDHLSHIDQGVVDLIYMFCTTSKMPESLAAYTVEIGDVAADPGRLWLMPAGNVPSGEYWRRLARISWHDMFYSESAPGIPLFLELKQRIEEEFAPDFLLIDSRTGITEVGGVATTILPDKVVCLAMKNRENLDGAREVLRSIKQSPRLPTQKPVEILPALTRIPELGPEKEAPILEEVRDFLNEEAPDLSATLAIEEVFILHSESDLELTEAIRVGGKKSAGQSPLLRDYLRLFSHLVPKGVVDPYVEPLIQEALIKSFESPELGEQDLRAIADYSGRPQAYAALLKFYRLRGIVRKALSTVQELWDLSGRTHDPLAWNIVKKYVPAELKRRSEDAKGKARPQPIKLDTIAEMWTAAGANDEEIATVVSNAFAEADEPQKGLRILRKLLDNDQVSAEAVTLYVKLLLSADEFGTAESIIDRFKEIFKQNQDFLTVWARVLLASSDEKKITHFVASKEFSNLSDVGSAVELLSRIGAAEDLRKLLRTRVARVIRQEGPSQQVADIQRAFSRVGLRSEFETILKDEWGEERANDMIRHLRYR
jgi:hypothetical protein